MDDVATKIIEILRKNMKDPSKTVTLETPLSDLEIESLDLAVIVFDIEDTFGIEIPYNANEEVEAFATVGSVVDRVKSISQRRRLRAPLLEPSPPGHPGRHRSPELNKQRMTQSNGRRRVVVTGQGVVTPFGTGVDRFWAGLNKRRMRHSAVGPFSTEDLYITIAGEVTDFDPRERLKSKALLLADNYSQFAGCAAMKPWPSQARAAAASPRAIARPPSSAPASAA